MNETKKKMNKMNTIKKLVLAAVLAVVMCFGLTGSFAFAEEADGKPVKITRVGKPCFDECPLEKKPCILNGNVAFGEATDK